MSYYNPHSQWNGSEPSQGYPAEASSINHRPTNGDDMGPGYYQLQNQPYHIHPSYNKPQFDDGSQETIEEVSSISFGWTGK